MSKNVFANGREVSAEKDDNRTMGAMPDVCLSPPSPPAGPVPVPYPNFAHSSDTDQGARTGTWSAADRSVSRTSPPTKRATATKRQRNPWEWALLVTRSRTPCTSRRGHST